MTKLLLRLVGGAILTSGLLTPAKAEANIDVSAVNKLVATDVSKLTSSEFESQFLSENAGGLALLRGRFKSADALKQIYALISESEKKAYQQCAGILTSLNSDFSSFKKQLTDITGVPLHDVTAYGVIGAGNTAATASPHAVVLGLEMLCGLTASNLEQSADIEQVLKNYLAHELVHVTQYRLTTRTDFHFNLLEMALLEGSADYVATLLLDEAFVLDDERVAFGQPIAPLLLDTFSKTMHTFDYAPWLYTQSPELNEGTAMPVDMGYWIGYQLASRYISNGGTLTTLLTLEDATAIYTLAVQ
jgi:hypothetical protein